MLSNPTPVFQTPLDFLALIPSRLTIFWTPFSISNPLEHRTLHHSRVQTIYVHQTLHHFRLYSTADPTALHTLQNSGPYNTSDTTALQTIQQSKHYSTPDPTEHQHLCFSSPLQCFQFNENSFKST